MTTTNKQDTQSIRTPFNQRPVRSNADTRRVLVNGRWQKRDPQASNVLNWLKGAN